MNGIELLLTKKVYKPGETIFGAIFYKLIKPTVVETFYVRLECRLKYNSSRKTIDKDLSHAAVNVFSLSSAANIGYYAFPFAIKLDQKAMSSLTISSSSKCIGPYRFDLQYNVVATACKGSCILLRDNKRFFVFSSFESPLNFQNISKTFTLPGRESQIEFSCMLQSEKPLVINIKASLNCTKSPKKEPFSPVTDLSVNISLERNHYELGDTVILVSKSKIATCMRINSISFRLNRRIELKREMLSLGNGEDDGKEIHLSEVLFGTILPAITNTESEFQIKCIPLSLPLPTAKDVSWTVDNASFKCHFYVEVSLNLSPDGPLSDKTDNSASTCLPPVAFTMPIFVIPPRSMLDARPHNSLDPSELSSQPQSSWVPLCLIALAEDESVQTSATINASWIAKRISGGGELKRGGPPPGQTIFLPGSKRGPAGLGPKSVQKNPEFTRLPVFRHFGATPF